MKIYILLVFLLVMGCNPKASVDSVPDAKILAEKFFEEFKGGNYEAIYPLYNEKFWEVMPKKTWSKILPNVNNELGELKGCELATWNQKTQASTSGTGNFVALQYTCKHEKYDSTISFTVLKPLSGGQSTIIGQNFNSIGFLIE
ncbi:DUF3887 domain-containing protein [Microbulbifer spongiae]|uniref:DUF3887 domain-containing protein n=1 Tax=Microbulbifer spongiae TaxID=2944933 RepID=A0ABY9EHQ3_9GAMM|nr:DUF4019 domain-containing protein [Microbulbifer sp. MI-G]WKD51723.1 DUF3887 domain-containing protein [Microbulbifer sp. MI-G]